MDIENLWYFDRNLRFSAWIVIFFIHCGGIMVGFIIDFTIGNARRATTIVIVLAHGIQLILMHIGCTILTRKWTVWAGRRWQQAKMWTQFVWWLIAGPAIDTTWGADTGCLLKCWKWRSQWCTERCWRTIRIYVTCFSWWFTLSPFGTSILNEI